MKQRKPLNSLDDVRLLVDSFYEKVREDDRLKNIFESIIQDRWPAHLDKMYRFWQTVLLGEHTYSGSPFLPHVKLPVEHLHFERWLELFRETVDEHFEGEKAREAKWRAEKMAEMFQTKIQYYQHNPSIRPL